MKSFYSIYVVFIVELQLLGCRTQSPAGALR